MIGYVGGLLLRFAGNLVLTRLLFPEVFGLMALITSVMVGLTMFSDIGIGPAIVQRPEGNDPRFLRTAWTIQCIRGAVLWIGACLLAKPLALFYGEPQLSLAIPVAGLTTVMLGFESTSRHTLARGLTLGRLTAVELAANAFGLAGMISLAAAHRSLVGPNHGSAIWAIIAGGLLGTLTRVAMSHLVLPGISHRFELDRGHARSLLRFGRWIFVSTVIAFLVEQSDRLVFGRLIPFELLGVYGIAVTLAMMLPQAAAKLSAAVLFPALSRIDEHQRFSRVFARARSPIVLAGATCSAWLVVAGPLFIALAYDPRYHGAGTMLQVLAVSSWFQTLESTNSAALLARGRVNLLAATRAAKLVAMLIFLPAGFHYWGFAGALWGLVASDLVKYGASLFGIPSDRLKTVIGDSSFMVGAGCLAWLGGAAITRWGHSAPLVLSLAMATTLVVLPGGVAFWYAWTKSASARQAAATR